MATRTSIYLGLGLLIMSGLIVSLLPGGVYQVATAISVCVLGIGLFYATHMMLENKDRQLETYRYELAVSRDKLQQLRLDYEHERQIDHLTKCYNEHHYVKEAARFIALNDRSGVKFSLALLRVDRFSAFLAEEGQQGANELLKILANLLHRGLRETDIVARIDNETFGLLLSDAADDDAVLVTERLMALARQIRHKGIDDGMVTISIGITSYRAQGDLVSLQSEAVEALEVAIVEGGDRIAVFATPESVAA